MLYSYLYAVIQKITTMAHRLNTNKQFMVGNGILAFAVIFAVSYTHLVGNPSRSKSANADARGAFSTSALCLQIIASVCEKSSIYCCSTIIVLYLSFSYFFLDPIVSFFFQFQSKFRSGSFYDTTFIKAVSYTHLLRRRRLFWTGCSYHAQWWKPKYDSPLYILRAEGSGGRNGNDHSTKR